VKIGPNVRKLICQKISLLAVPAGGGVADAIGFLSDKDKIVRLTREATAWVEIALRAVREAPGGEAYGDDEAIAGEILRQVEEKQKAARKGNR